MSNQLSLKRIFLLCFAMLALQFGAASGYAADEKPCYICRPDYVPGEPVEGNRTLGQIIQINYGLLQGADLQLMADLDLYCRKFKVVNERSHLTLRRRLIEPMVKDARNGDVTSFFVEGRV